MTVLRLHILQWKLPLSQIFFWNLKAVQYGEKLGVTDEQQEADRAHLIVEVAEEYPKYMTTESPIRARAALNKYLS